MRSSPARSGRSEARKSCFYRRKRRQRTLGQSKMKSKSHPRLTPFLPVKILGLTCLAGALLWLNACSLPQAQADPTRYYLLSTAAANSTAEPAAGAPALHVRQIELASYIRSRPLIVRKGNNE